VDDVGAAVVVVLGSGEPGRVRPGWSVVDVVGSPVVAVVEDDPDGCVVDGSPWARTAELPATRSRAATRRAGTAGRRRGMGEVLAPSSTPGRRGESATTLPDSGPEAPDRQS
jgi:hypothetical protein